jgi:glucokinase
MQDYVIGVDIGGTNIKAGVVDHSGNILARKRTPTEARLGSEAILRKLTSLVNDLRSGFPDARLKAVGFGIPGAIRSRDGIVTQAPNIPAWDGAPVRKMLQERLAIPCFIENDANAITVGEMWVGAGRGYNHICCLTLGTGVGGGVIIEGELLRGSDGMGAELGHMAIQMDGPRCNCGSYGCLEMYASATGILRMLREAIEQTPSGPLYQIPASEVTTQIIYENAKAGDALSLQVLESAGAALGVGLASYVNIFNPEIIIIGGGVAAAWDILMPHALRTMQQRAFKAPAARVKVVRAEKEDDAGIHGSAYIAWDLLQQGDKHSTTKERSLTPWGFWQVLEEGKDYKVKRIYVHPGHRLSYQRHEKRQETWMIATGEALAVIDDKEYRLKPGETIHFGFNQAHRIGNPSTDQPLIFLEVQRGSYFGEDDIVRLQDDYKRAGTK